MYCHFDLWDIAIINYNSRR